MDLAGLFRLVGFLALVFLPGGWITFGLRLPGLKFGSRFLIGITLAPLIVAIQFYALRLFGIRFDTVLIVLILVNIPAGFLIVRQISKPVKLDWHIIIGCLIVFGIIFAVISPQIIFPQARVFTGHGWYWSAPIYSLANGEIDLQDPDLAGIRYAYPWTGFVYQASLSALLGSAPVYNYILTNLIWLLVTLGLMVYLMDELGGSKVSKILVLIWLALGVNFVGNILARMNSIGNLDLPWVFGDPRYSPWLVKFLFFQKDQFAIALYAGLAILLIKTWKKRIPISVFILVFTILCGIGATQTIIFPAGVALVGAKIIADLYDVLRDKTTIPFRRFIGFGLSIIGSTVISFFLLEFFTRDRISRGFGFPGPLAFSSIGTLTLRAVQCLIVFSPFIICYFIGISRIWHNQRNSTIVLSLGAISSLFLNIVIHFPIFGNEYKYIYLAAICLAPFPAIVLEPFLKDMKWKVFILYGILTLVLILPFIDSMKREWPWFTMSSLSTTPPEIGFESFHITLGDNHPYAELVRVIREDTPLNTLLVAEKSELYLPALAERGLYAPPTQKGMYPGVNIPTDDLLTIVKRYDPAILSERRQVLNNFYHSNNCITIKESLVRFLAFNRPLAIVVEMPAQMGLSQWLEKNDVGRLIFRDQLFELWVKNSDHEEGIQELCKV